jgi:hypothetical protein
MSMTPYLLVDGEVERPLRLSLADLVALDARYQVEDVSQLDPRRTGRAVRLDGLLSAAQPKPAARWLTVHASADNFHASVPLAVVRGRAVLIYQAGGLPLPKTAGGPLRFLIPDFAACHTDEIDECANVKFVDHIELSIERGTDNRPIEEQQHAELHRRQADRPE